MREVESGAAHQLKIPSAEALPAAAIRPSHVEYTDLVARAQQDFERWQDLLPEIDSAFPAPNSSLEGLPEPTYPTVFGMVSFVQLYAKTHRIAGAQMQQQFGMSNPQDIDDCLQVGYLKVWQRLEQEPSWLADKPKRYIVQAVVLRSKAQRFSHQRYYRKLVYDADVEQVDSSRLTTNQVDTWIDLQQCLSWLARAMEDQPVILLSLYTLITQAKQQDVARTFGHGVATLGKYQRQVKATLANALVGYGPPATDPQLPVLSRPEGVFERQSVTQQLLEDWDPAAPVSNSVVGQGRVFSPLYSPKTSQPAHQEQARPEEQTFPTGWAGSATLEAIVTDPVVRRAAYAKARQLGLEAGDQEDCIQKGMIKLWEKLQDEPELLQDRGPVWAGIYITYSGNSKAFHRHYQRRRRFSDPDFDWHDADEYLAIGLDKRVSWTQVIDEQLDITGFMRMAAMRYENDIRKLLGLYALTTSVQTKDIASMLGMHEKNYAAAVGNRVKKEVQQWWREYFDEPIPEDWQAKLARGEGLEHVTALAERIQDNQRLLLALYVVTTSAKRKAVAETFGMGLTCFGRAIREIKVELRKTIFD